MLTVVDRYRDVLGRRAHAALVADTHARWSGRLLAEGDGRGALPHALERLVRAPSPTALWIVAKSAMVAAVQLTS